MLAALLIEQATSDDFELIAALNTTAFAEFASGHVARILAIQAEEPTEYRARSVSPVSDLPYRGQFLIVMRRPPCASCYVPCIGLGLLNTID